MTDHSLLSNDQLYNAMGRFALDYTETFEESDVMFTPSTTQSLDPTTTFDDVVVTSESLELGVSDTTGSSASISDSSTTSQVGDNSGLQINPNTELLGVGGTISNNASGFEIAELYDDANDVVESRDISNLSAGDTFYIIPDDSLQAGKDYGLLIGTDGGTNYTRMENDSVSTPVGSDDIDINNGYAGKSLGPDTTLYNLTEAIAVKPKPLSSGSAVIEWLDAGDVSRWDLATYQATENGETVTVDVIDGNGNVLQSSIDPETDISNISSDTTVRLQANLERTDTSNNPTLDFAQRRWIR